MIEGIKSILRKSWLVCFLYKRFCQFCQALFFTDERYIVKIYKTQLGAIPNLDNPVKFSEKIQWIKLNWRDPRMILLADKYLCREYITSTIGKGYLNEFYAIYEDVDDIDLSKLPHSFILKTTHGSAWNIICYDKDKQDWKDAFGKLRLWMKCNYFYIGREWAYKDIKPRIVCERLLKGDDGRLPIDYKFYCFNGEPKVIQVIVGRFYKYRRNFYDNEWNLLDLSNIDERTEYDIKRPDKFEEMLEVSKKLSKDFPFVRVDLYFIDGKVYFGEMTFYPENGIFRYMIEHYDIKLGEWLSLPEKLI